jgi:hypothetical protein
MTEMTQPSSRLRMAFLLSWLVMTLAAIAAAVGLFAPSIYRAETAWVVPQSRGQDMVTLLTLVVMVPVLRAAQHGSPRATLIWLGLLGYLAYTYTGAAFAYAFNEPFPVYVALFGGTGAALIAGLSSVDAARLQGAFSDQARQRGGVSAGHGCVAVRVVVRSDHSVLYPR